MREEELYDRVLEETLVGNGLRNERYAYRLVAELKAEDFFAFAPRVVFEVFCDLVRSSSPVEFSTVYGRIRDRGMDRGIPPEYLHQLCGVPLLSERGLEEGIRRLKELSGKRRLKGALVDVLRSLPERAYDELRRDFLEVLTHELSPAGKAYTSEELVEEFSEVLSRPGGSSFLTGFSSLDRLISYRGGALYVVLAARPGMGKTSFLLNMLLRNAAEGRRVLFFSLEMSRQEIMYRVASILSGVPLTRIREGYMTEEEADSVRTALGVFASYDFRVVDDPAVGLDGVMVLSRLSSPDLVAIDYLQLVEPDSRLRMDRREVVTEVSRGLKFISRSLDVPVVAVAQLSRRPEERADRRPQLADIRESGQIEQDADLVVFLYREEYYRRQVPPELAGIMEVNVAKQRQGPTGIVKMHFDGSTQRLSEIEGEVEFSGGESEDFDDVDF